MSFVFPCLIGISLLRIASRCDSARYWRWCYWIAGSLLLVAQLYAGYYFGWFLILSLGIAIAWSVILPSTRTEFRLLLRRDLVPIAAAVAIAAVGLRPFFVHYTRAARDLGVRPFAEVQLTLPQPQSWLHVGTNHWVWGWTASREVFKDLPLEYEHRIGFGYITPLICALGFSLQRGRKSVCLTALVLCTLVVFATSFPSLSFWRILYEWIPGGSAIRAVTRVGLITLLLASIGFASFVQSEWATRRPWLTSLLCLICIVEQGVTTPSYDKGYVRRRVLQLASRIDPNCDSFYYHPRPERLSFNDAQLDALWASLHRRVPTINGYSGGFPPGWSGLLVVNAPGGPTPHDALGEWARFRKLPWNRICQIIDD